MSYFFESDKNDSIFYFGQVIGDIGQCAALRTVRYWGAGRLTCLTNALMLTRLCYCCNHSIAIAIRHSELWCWPPFIYSLYVNS